MCVISVGLCMYKCVGAGTQVMICIQKSENNLQVSVIIFLHFFKDRISLLLCVPDKLTYKLHEICLCLPIPIGFWDCTYFGRWVYFLIYKFWGSKLKSLGLFKHFFPLSLLQSPRVLYVYLFVFLINSVIMYSIVVSSTRVFTLPCIYFILKSRAGEIVPLVKCLTCIVT